MGNRPSIDIVPPVRCKAKSSRTGQPCKQFAIVGGTVCHFHGGAAPQVKKAAQERLARLVPYAEMGIAQLAGVPYLNPETNEVEQKHVEISPNDAIRLRALQDIMDRAGLKGAEKLEITEQIDNAALDSMIQAALESRRGE